MTPASCSSSLLSLLLIISFTGLPVSRGEQSVESDEPQAEQGAALIQTGQSAYGGFKAATHLAELSDGNLEDFLLDEESNDDVNDMLEEVKVILNKPAAETKVGKEALDCNTMELPESFMSVVFSLGWCALLPEIMAFAAALAGFGTLRSLLARPEGPTKAAEEELEQEEAAENWSLYEEDEMNESVMRLSQRETTDVFGCTALHMAAHSGSAERVQELLAKGFSPNAREAWDETPLHMAARAGNVQACSSLVKAGATLDAMNADDKTPLMVAAQAKQEGVCELLLDLGAGCGGAAAAAECPALAAPPLRAEARCAAL